jgi:hypothetical protein
LDSFGNPLSAEERRRPHLIEIGEAGGGRDRLPHVPPRASGSRGPTPSGFEYPQYAPGYHAVLVPDPDGVKLVYVDTPGRPT